jgi:hypothetical protein
VSPADDRIYVRIAAYREFDLVPTVRDALAQAEDPDRLRIGICWQHTPDESLAELADDPRVDVIDVDFRESRGACWARSLLQQRWDGEPFTFGLDGHHRFVPGWDRRLVDLTRDLQEQGSPKPILTGYAPSYDPEDDPAGRDQRVWLTGFDRFEPRGVVFLRPYVPETPPTGPVPARFWSGHCNFTVGRWNEEVPIDPDAYFHSEEIVLTARSFTHGYDLYLPPTTIVWHEYLRRNRVCHWDDHDSWVEHSAATVDTYRRLFGVDGEPPLPDTYAYGFGTERTLADYERYAGIDFARRGVQRFTVENGIPPNPPVAPEDWVDSLLLSREMDLVVPRRVLDQGCDLVGIFVNAADGAEVHRVDLDAADLAALLERQPSPLVRLHLELVGAEAAATWTVWPHRADTGWLEPVTERCTALTDANGG